MNKNKKLNKMKLNKYKPKIKNSKMKLIKSGKKILN